MRIPTPMELQTDECPFDDYEVLGAARLEVVGMSSDVTERKKVLDSCCNRGVSFKICNDFQTSDCETWKSHSET